MGTFFIPRAAQSHHPRPDSPYDHYDKSARQFRPKMPVAYQTPFVPRFMS